jgi:hypothetical protein
MAEQKSMVADSYKANNLDEARREYIALLMSILESYGASSKEVNRQLQDLSDNSSARIGQDLIDLIKALCDCSAVHIILECLCKLFT